MPDVVTTILDQVTPLRALVDAMLQLGSSNAPSSSVSDGVPPNDRLRGLLIGLERLRNAAEGVQALVMTEMGREALAADAVERGDTDRPIRSHEEFVPDEVAALLSCTRAAAANRYGLAWRAHRYEPVSTAWRCGSIDARKVEVITDQLVSLSPEAAISLAPSAVEHAGRHTAPQTREWLGRKVLAIDPGAAERRREAAIAERKVVITPSTDGMSDLWARLPSVEARRMQVALSRLAQGLGSGDPRTMDQRRADVLVDLVLGRSTPVGVDLQLVVPTGAATGASREPAWIPGLGPITAAAASELLDLATSKETSVDALLIVDADTGRMTSRVEPRYRPSLSLDKAVRSRDVTCRFPGCRRSALGRASGTDLDHTVPWPEGVTSDGNLAVLCRHHHRLKHSAGWTVTLDGDGTMRWTTPSGRPLTTEPWSYADPATEQGGADERGGADRQTPDADSGHDPPPW